MEKLDKVPLDMKEKALKKGVREAVKFVGLAARKNITQPGYKGDKDRREYPPLSKNIKWAVRGRKKDTFVGGHVGADYIKAPHFHLYEQGHKMVTKDGETVGVVHGQKDFKRTVDETREKMKRLLITTIEGYMQTLKEK